jgi:hypothetical protein
MVMVGEFYNSEVLAAVDCGDHLGNGATGRPGSTDFRWTLVLN